MPFAASDVFGGPCAGFVFKTGDKELGYYSEEEEGAATDGSRGAMDAIKYDLPPMDEFQARKAMTGPEIDGRRELLTWEWKATNPTGVVPGGHPVFPGNPVSSRGHHSPLWVSPRTSRDSPGT